MTETLERFAPLSDEMLADPHAVYRAMRAASPVHWHEQLQAWLVFNFSDCVRVLSDAEVFVSDYRKIGEHIPEDVLQVQTLDAPEHGRVRKSVTSALRGLDVSAWTAAMVEEARQRLGHLAGGEFDFVTSFNEPFARTCMATLFGVERLGEPGRFEAAQRALVLSMDGGLAPERSD